MRNKKLYVIVGIILLATGVFLWIRGHGPKGDAEDVREVTAVMGRVRETISTTGAVLPRNRLEVKPTVGGRIEEILVREGERVKTGQILAWMSSTERAALLDAARGQGEESLKYWKDAYKPIPLISAIDGEVIVSKMQPGQTVGGGSAVIVLSDKLIVQAQVDETDVRRIEEGQTAVVTLDAYPDEKFDAVVEHIYRESKTVSNVTVYEVDLLAEKMPAFARSGMNTTVDFVMSGENEKVLVPLEAVEREGEEDFVLVGPKGIRRPVTLGKSGDENVEILSGLEPGEIVLIKEKKYRLPEKQDTKSNPFMPSRRR
jgi:macrolide-specific efflux system membrane fusion protein